MTQEHKVIEENTLCVLYNNKESIIFLLAGKAADTAQKVEIYFFLNLGFKQNVIYKANIKQVMILT